MITHEEAKVLLNKGWIDGLTNEEYESLMKYVYHQEKVTELLGLYREKSNFLTRMMYRSDLCYDDYMKLLKNIDKLEKEMEKMK